MQHQRRSVVGLGVAAGLPVLVALALLPVRSEIRDANVALVLVLAVLGAAIVDGRQGGAVAAVVATLAFDVFFTHPYGSLRIATRDDVETTVLLLGVGLVAGELVVRARRSAAAAARSGREIQRMRRVAQTEAGSDTPARLVDTVRRELLDLLPIEQCWFERPPFPTTMPMLRHGRVTFPSGDPTLGMLDPTPSRLLEVRVVGRGEVRGRYVLEFPDATTGIGLPIETRATVCALADQLGAALAAHPDLGD